MGAKPLKLGLICLFVALVFMSLMPTAYAHTLAKDGKISAFLHIDPYDTPLPGKVNTIHFYFNDQDFRFSMDGCFCNVSVNEGKRAIYKGVLPASDLRVGKINVLLPDNNFSYDVVINGTPKAAGYFQPFKLKFDIDVGKPPPEPPARREAWPFVVGSLLLIGCGSMSYYYLRKRAKIRLHKE
jgi:hypothetical protein